MDDLSPQSALIAHMRPPSQVMRLSRMGAGFATRLSFSRSLIRRLHHDGAKITRPLWELDDDGYGQAVYSVRLAGHVYSLVCFSHALPDRDRSDRVIAERWDATFALFDGTPSRADLDRLSANVPKQEAGRVTAREIVLSRANKSVRLFDHTRDRLATGQQPDPAMIDAIGYLMRTTAVYGNGKFGLADRAEIAAHPGLAGPFQAEMLTVWLIREFTLDLVEHVARAQAPATAVPLAPAIRQHLGVGNATGLGMAPFLVTHPELTHNWVFAREAALATVRRVQQARPAEIERFIAVLDKAIAHAGAWKVEDGAQMARIEVLRSELASLRARARPDMLAMPHAWDTLLQAATRYSEETQECLVSILLEPHGPLIDHFAEDMAAGPPARLDAAMTLADLSALIQGHYGWALALDFDDPLETHQFWYVSEDKQEPRLGLRREEPGADLETPLDIARQVQHLMRALPKAPPGDRVAAFVMANPELRSIVERVQIIAQHPYGEIRDNLIGAGCRPIDLLRFKLAFFGAARFDPKSDRWTRITLFQGAPLAGQIADCDPDAWCFATPPAMGFAP